MCADVCTYMQVSNVLSETKPGPIKQEKLYSTFLKTEGNPKGNRNRGRCQIIGFN